MILHGVYVGVPGSCTSFDACIVVCQEKGNIEPDPHIRKIP